MAPHPPLSRVLATPARGGHRQTTPTFGPTPARSYNCSDPERQVSMRALTQTFRDDETYEAWRQRMLDETARFIEWGLAHPNEVRWIPTHPVGKGRFSQRTKAAFWRWIMQDS